VSGRVQLSPFFAVTDIKIRKNESSAQKMKNGKEEWQLSKCGSTKEEGSLDT
jgi:hypothetical protein